MQRLQFQRPDGQFIQSDTSLNMISYFMGVMTALGVLGYSVVQDMDSGRWEAWKEGELQLVFFETEN